MTRTQVDGEHTSAFSWYLRPDYCTMEVKINARRRHAPGSLRGGSGGLRDYFFCSPAAVLTLGHCCKLSNPPPPLSTFHTHQPSPLPLPPAQQPPGSQCQGFVSPVGSEPPMAHFSQSNVLQSVTRAVSLKKSFVTVTNTI